MERAQEGKSRWMPIGLLAGIAIVAALGVLFLSDDPEATPPPALAAPADSIRQTVVTTTAKPERPPATLPDEEPKPEDNVPLAVPPRDGEAWALLRVPLRCELVPPIFGPPVVGHATPVTWPGGDHQPQPDGVEYPVIPMQVTASESEATATTSLPVIDAGTDPVRHVARLVLPGFAPTEFSFISTGVDQPVTCEEPIELVAAANGVVGIVRLQDGSPAEGAIVDGCGTQVIAGSNGDYFLLPREKRTCGLRARYAPGTTAETAPQRVEPLASEDQVLDFVVEVPAESNPGVEIFRTDDGEVWVRPDDSGPWARKIPYGARIFRVGETLANTLSDDELLEAMVRLDETIYLEQYFESEDGENVRMNTEVTEL